MFMTCAHLYLREFEVRLYASSNPARGVSGLWQSEFSGMAPAEIKLKQFTFIRDHSKKMQMWTNQILNWLVLRRHDDDQAENFDLLNFDVLKAAVAATL